MVLLGSGFSGQFPFTWVYFLQTIDLPIIHLNLWKNMLYLYFLYRNLILKEGRDACTIFLNHECGGHRRIKKNITLLSKKEPTLWAANWELRGSWYWKFISSSMGDTGIQKPLSIWSLKKRAMQLHSTYIIWHPRKGKDNMKLSWTFILAACHYLLRFMGACCHWACPLWQRLGEWWEDMIRENIVSYHKSIIDWHSHLLSVKCS